MTSLSLFLWLRRPWFCLLCTALLITFSVGTAAADKPPIRVGLDAEFGLQRSTSAQAIELGLNAAIHEINAAGGLLGGRKIELIKRDNRSIPARGVQNLKELADMPDVVAVFGGRFSPVVLEQVPVIKEKRIPFIAVWSAADGIVSNNMQPNYVFRVSLRDSLAMPFLMQSAERRGFSKVGLLLVNTAWGRSNFAAAENYVKTGRGPKIVRSDWFSWADTTLISKYQAMVDAGAQAIIVVSNDELSILVREMAALPAQKRVPLIAHWGVTGGDFVSQVGEALTKVDLSVVQTFSFLTAEAAARERFVKAATAVGLTRLEDIRAPTGTAHAYDAMHLLARAITKAGSTDRDRVRTALEQLPPYRGLVRHYEKPFSRTNHEALTQQELMMTRFSGDGALVPR